MYRIEEFPEVWADACLRDDEGRFMFLSIYGRDGSLMQLLAACELSAGERGIKRFHLLAPDGTRHRTEVGDVQRLTKRTSRLPRQNLFGPISHMWLFDAALQTPDRVNRIGWALHHASGAHAQDADALLQECAWRLINSLSPVALLDHWRQPVIEWCQEKGAMQLAGSRLYPALGPVQAMRVSLTEHFTRFISCGVREGRLRLE